MKIRKLANLYKLTDENGQTCNGTQWGEGITNCAKHGKGVLCSKHYVHAYTHPLLALLLNPIYGNIKNPRLWKAKGRIVKGGKLEIGCKALTTICEIPCPTITMEQHIRFGSLCSDGFAAYAKRRLWQSNIDAIRQWAIAHIAVKAAEAAWEAVCGYYATRKPSIDLAATAEKAMTE